MGLVVELAPFRRCLVGDRAMSPGEGKSFMNKQSCENAIEVLKKVRDTRKSQLDDGVLSDLDRAISDLEKARDGGLSVMEASKLTLRVLQVIAMVVRILTNISDWMK